jgi:hypothetical protein
MDEKNHGLRPDECGQNLEKVMGRVVFTPEISHVVFVIPF